MVGQQKKASNIAGYLGATFASRGYTVVPVDVRQFFLAKLLPFLRSLSLSSEDYAIKHQREAFFSIRAWEHNTKWNGRLLDRCRKNGDLILQTGGMYAPHSDLSRYRYYVFTHYNMVLSLRDKVTSWMPQEAEQAAWLEKERDLYANAQGVFVGGEYLKASMIEDYGISPEKIVVAGGGVDDFFLRNKPSRVHKEVTNRLLFVGYDFERKGGKEVIAAFKILKKAMPELQLDIIGPEKRSGLDCEGVNWIGRLDSRDEMLPYYRNADLFVMPSWRDSFGYVFLEAMSQGVPCIGASHMAMPEIIQEGITGYTVGPGDVDELVAKIKAFYKEPSVKEKMGHASIDRVYKFYTWGRVVDLIVHYVDSQ